MKLCPRCNTVTDEFCRSSRSKDGLAGWCKDCCRNYMRGRKSDPARRRKAAKSSSRAHPEKLAAREKVKDAIRNGTLPPAKSLQCVDCGRPANAYDHADHSKPLDVEAVCFECHGKRSRARGEHRRAGHLLDGKEYRMWPGDKWT